MTEPGNATSHPVKLQVAQHCVSSVNGITVTSGYLASVIQEITVETQIAGVTILHLYIIDPYWVVMRSGLLDKDESGELANDVDVNFPEGSDLWWRLAMVDYGNEISDANLELTFIDRAVAYMQDDWGGLTVAPGTTTRAQFVKQLVDRVSKVLHVPPLSFVCPELNVVQPVASSTTSSGGTTTTTTLANIAAAHAKANKSKGVGHGAAITIKGQAPTSTQIALINQVMGIANGLNAGNLATQALIEACIQENGFTNNPGGSGSSSGLLQLLTSTAAGLGISQLDVNACVIAFLTKGFYGHGGAIAQAKANPNQAACVIAQNTQGSAYPTAYCQWLAEANAIIAAGGGASTGSLGTTTGTSTTSGTFDASQLTRGTPQNPDEDSWTCGQRLAGDVNFYLFSNGSTMYYMDGPDLIAQTPALYLALSANGISWTATDPATGRKKVSNSASRVITSLRYTDDNTAFKWNSTHKRRGRVQRKTAIKKPQTASQLKLNMVCGIFEFRAGDVFVFQDAGPANGRWIVEDTTRNVFADQHTQFTLGPPTAPYPEPQAQSAGAAAGLPSSPGSAAGGVSAPGPATQAQLAAQQGTLAGVVIAAKLALQAEQAHPGTYVYTQQPSRGNGGTLFGPAPRTMDCSSFATLCYKEAGLADPSHLNYSPIGYTGSMIGHFVQVPAGGAQPGDLCFFGSSTSATTHVNVYIGNGQSISMGGPGDPHQGPAASMGPSGFLGYFHQDLIALRGPSTPARGAQAPSAVGITSAAAGRPATLAGGLDVWLF